MENSIIQGVSYDSPIKANIRHMDGHWISSEFNEYYAPCDKGLYLITHHMSANTGDSIFWSYYPEHEKIDTLTKKNLELPNHYFVSITPKEHPVHGDCWSIHFNKSGFKLLKENEQFSTGKEKDQKFYSYLQEFVEHSKKILDIDKIGTAWTHTPDSFLEENYNEQVHLSNMLKRIIAGQPVLY